MRISDWSSDVCSSDLSSRCSSGTEAPNWPPCSSLLLASVNYSNHLPGSARKPGFLPGKHGGRPVHADRGRMHGQLRSEEQTSELQSLMRNSYAVLCLKKKTKLTQ